MQPYFFPYIGHFSLIASVDQWIVFDITQYTPKTWMNRNRILHPDSGWQYITVPLSNSSNSIKTKDARILDPISTKMNILGKVSHYKKKAPFYREVVFLIQDVFDKIKNDSLVELNVEGLVAVCRYLDVPFNYKICSQMDLPLPNKLGPGEWAPEICNILGATDYVNPPGGRAIFDPVKFSQYGISLNYVQTKEFAYETSPYIFEPNLSILDVLMWNPPSVVRNIIKNVELIN